MLTHLLEPEHDPDIRVMLCLFDKKAIIKATKYTA